MSSLNSRQTRSSGNKNQEYLSLEDKSETSDKQDRQTEITRILECHKDDVLEGYDISDENKLSEAWRVLSTFVYPDK
jgi:hypothetical protein